MRQWAELARTGSYDITGFAGASWMTRPGPPVHALVLKGDDFAPRAAMQHGLDKLTQREVNLQTWENPPHGGNHNRWPSEPEFVIGWLQKSWNTT